MTRRYFFCIQASKFHHLIVRHSVHGFRDMWWSNWDLSGLSTKFLEETPVDSSHPTCTLSFLFEQCSIYVDFENFVTVWSGCWVPWESWEYMYAFIVQVPVESLPTCMILFQLCSVRCTNRIMISWRFSDSKSKWSFWILQLSSPNFQVTEKFWILYSTSPSFHFMKGAGYYILQFQLPFPEQHFCYQNQASVSREVLNFEATIPSPSLRFDERCWIGYFQVLSFRFQRSVDRISPSSRVESSFQ